MIRDFKVEERVMYNNNLSNVLDFAQGIIDAVRETEDSVSNIERDLLGIDPINGSRDIVIFVKRS